MMNRATLRSGLAALALIAVSACSAAGQNASGLPAAGAGPSNEGAAARAASGAPGSKTLAGAALSIAGSSSNYNQAGSTGGRLISLLHAGHSLARTRKPHTVAPPCNNGIEYSSSSSGQGQVTQILEYFYDSACTRPADLFTLNASYAAAGGSALATETRWDQNGTIVAYCTYSVSFANDAYGNLSQVQVQQTSSTAPGAPPLAQSGYTCLLETGNAVDCGSGVVDTLAAPSTVATSSPSPPPAPGDVGFEQTVVGVAVTPSPGRGHDRAAKRPGDRGWGGDGPSGLQFTINGAAFAGPAGSLTLSPGTAPAWTIDGGTQVDALTGTATIGFGGYWHGHDGWRTGRERGGHDGWGGGMSGISLTLVDSADGLTVKLSGRGGGLIGTVTQTAGGRQVATMYLDFFGNGNVVYSGGVTSPVRDWVIVN
jgi:hypothetical protein